MQIAITIRGDKETIKRLEKMGQSFFNFKSEMEEIGTLVKQYAANEATASQGGVLGAAWPKLNPKYAVWKAKHFPGRSPLMRTGNMARRYGFTAKDQSVTITNAADYFKWHQLGTQNMPQRLTLAINGIQKRMMVQIINAGVQRKIERAM